MSNIQYNGKFSWKITDPLDVSEFLNCTPGTKFSSEIFNVGGLKWQLYAYPAGKYKPNKYTKNPIKGCELYLQLISSSWPQNVYKILFNYRLFCFNASSSFTNIQQFVKNQDHYVSWYRGTLTTNELEALEGQIINLQSYINILKIIAIDQKSIIYQFPYKNDKNLIQFEWKINDIDGLFINTKCGKHIESKIFDHFWCLRIAPKGWKLKEQRYVNLWLQLCCLPMNISKISINYELKCIETGTYYSGHTVLDYNVYHKNAGWNQRKLNTNSLKKYNTLTFQCKIQILKKYNLNGYLVDDIAMNKRSDIHSKDIISNAVMSNDNNNNMDDVKSSEIDGLKQEITKLNKKVAEMQQIIINLQSKVGINDHTEDDEKKNDEDLMRNMNIIKMMKEMKNEIELLKKNNSDNKSVSNTFNPIEEWLKNVVKLPEYYDLFKQNGLEDMTVIKMLTIKELEKLGIQKLGHQLKILSAIQDLKMKDNNIIHGNEINEGQQHYPSPGNSNFI